jgi:hypothetical protein
MPCSICGALNRFDMTKPQVQTYTLLHGHACDHPKCNLDLDISKGTSDYREIPLGKEYSGKLFVLTPESCTLRKETQERAGIP